MRLLLPAALLPFSLWAQFCAAPEALAPGALASGKLDGSSCRLTDGSGYAEYRLVLPVRGRLQLEVASPDAELAIHLRDAAGTRIERGPSVNRAVEAGTYGVRVSARTADQNAAYTLRTAFSPAPNLFCDGFPSMGLNQSVAGKLGPSGCMTPGGAPYDGYAVHSFGQGTLEVTAQDADFPALLTLRDWGGYAVATGEGTLSFGLNGDANYTIVVTGGGKTGSYRISTVFRPAEGDPCAPKASLTASDRKGGALNAQSCAFDADGQGDLLSYDLYEIRLADAGAIELNASSTAFDPVLYLIDGAGNHIAADVAAGGRGTAVLRAWLRAGTYTVMLVSSQTAGGAYTLQYTAQAGNPQPCAANLLTLAQEAAGTLSASGCRTRFGLSDVYKLTLPAAGTLELAMQSDAFDTFLAIRDEKDDIIVTNDDYNGLSNSYLPVDLAAGTYTIVAASNGGGGAYTLLSRLSQHELTPCSRLEQLGTNTGVVRYMGFTPCRGANGEPEDYYEFTLDSAGTVAAVLSSQLVDGFLTLTDASGKVLRSDDNSYGGGDAIVVEYLTAGTYRLAVRAAQTSATGAYELDLLHRPGERPAGCAPRAALEIGSTMSGNINFTGCQLPGDFADVYQFTVGSAGTIELRVESKEFDAYAVLLDAGGNTVAADDNSGGSGNARLATGLQPGTYYAIARAFGDSPYDSGGAYTIVLSAVPDAAPASIAAAVARAAANPAQVDHYRHDQNDQVRSFNRLAGVREPSVYQRGQRQKQKAQ